MTKDLAQKKGQRKGECAGPSLSALRGPLLASASAGMGKANSSQEQAPPLRAVAVAP